MRRFVCVAAFAVAAVACGQVETNAQTGKPAKSVPAQRSEVAPLVLEFDVPPEFSDRSAVTGFRVGFFRANESTALESVDVARETVSVQNRTVRVTVAREKVPQCGGDCVVRVQTLSPTEASAWSDPVRLDGAAAGQRAAASVQLPPRQPRGAGRDQPRGSPIRRSRPGLTSTDVENHALLLESLRKVLPADAEMATELARFRRIEDLALAVVISRDHDIPFTTFSKAIEGPPRVTPRNALTKLRQDLDARSTIRKARPEVQRLMRVAESPGNTVKP